MARKAAAGAGTIRKKTVTRGSSVYVYWEARYTAGYDPGTGKQIQKSITGKTQKEVRAKLQAVSVELNQGAYQDPLKMTVAEWMDIWLKEYTGDVKTLTLSSYEGQVKHNILPAIGALKLQSLTSAHIQKMYNDMQRREKPLSPKSIKNMHGILHRALEQAVEVKFIKYNPSDACRLPRVVKKEIAHLESNEITLFLEAIKGHQYEHLFYVDIFTGMRQGELLGLKWEDINFTKGTIHIRRQLIREKKTGNYILTTLKNDKTRQITPAPTVIRVLREHRFAQNSLKVQAGDLWQDAGLVFTNALGGHLAHITVYKAFKRIVKSIGLPGTRFHDLRHTYAAASLDSGDDIKTLQENMGHHSAAFTMDTYGHLTEKMKKDSSNRMESFINKVKVV